MGRISWRTLGGHLIKGKPIQLVNVDNAKITGKSRSTTEWNSLYSDDCHYSEVGGGVDNTRWSDAAMRSSVYIVTGPAHEPYLVKCTVVILR